MKDIIEVIHIHIKLRVCRVSFPCIWRLKIVTRFFFENSKVSLKTKNCWFVVLSRIKHFRLHFYVASLSIKTCFYETSNVFTSSIDVFSKLLDISESLIKIKGNDLHLNTFHNFPYFRSYLQTTCAWKRDCTVPSPLQML